MVVALLGLGTVGKAVYDGIADKQGRLFLEYGITIKYVLVRNTENKPIQKELLTTDYTKIVQDEEVDCILEMMGASVSYAYIKQALENNKHVITANKEVMASHFSELEGLAKAHNRCILYEAAVGGGIPVVTTLNNLAEVNTINRIEGILNGTTNFILTNMHISKIAFAEALKIAQEKGFAEADPSADLLGLDMVRKIAILSQIAYQSEIDVKDVYSYGIDKLTKEVVDVVDLLGYTLKFMCYSRLDNGEIAIGVEPFILKKNDLLANVNYEYNVIRYEGDHCGIQTMVGKGAGPLTANSILNDLKLLVGGYKSFYKISNEYNVIGSMRVSSKYFLQLLDKIDASLIETNLGNICITKEMTYEQFIQIKPLISFYARIKE